MEINDTRLVGTIFGSLRDGDVFCAIINDTYEYFIKTDTDIFNAVNLGTGSAENFIPDDPVTLVKAILTIS